MNICRRFNMRKNDATSSVRRWGWLSRVAELVTWSSLSIFEDKICKFHGQAVDHNGEYTVCICMHHFIWMEVPGVSAFWVWHSLETSCGRDATGGCCVEHQCRNRGSGKKSTLGFGALSLQPWHFWERRPDISHCSQLKDKYVMAKHTHIDTLRHCVWIDMDRNDREPANFPWVLLQKRRSQLLQSPEGPVGMPNGQPFWWRWVDMGNSNSTGFTDFCKTSRGFKLGRLHREWGVGVFFSISGRGERSRWINLGQIWYQEFYLWLCMIFYGSPNIDTQLCASQRDKQQKDVLSFCSKVLPQNPNPDKSKHDLTDTNKIQNQTK